MNHWKMYSAVLIVLAIFGAAALAFGLTQDEVCVVGDPACTPTGAHVKHTPVCSVCHSVAGRLAFDPNGPAYRTGLPTPSFDATAKSCSNVACHAVSPGTFSYYFPGDEVDADGYPIPVLKTVNYGGGTPSSTPNWYTTGQTCSACHGNPPANGSDGSNAWHSSYHANNQYVGPINPNACELCHNDPTQPYGTWVPIALSAVGADGKYHGYQINTAIVNNKAAAAQHANGTASVLAQFRTQCFGCH